MHYFELTVTACVLKDIPFNQSNEKIACLINSTMLQDDTLAAMHEESRYKFYVFNSFYPIEKDKVYRSGRIYVFKIRSMDQLFIQKIQKLLPKTNVKEIKILATELNKYNKKHIMELYTLTPVVITVEDKPWLPGDDFDLLQDRLQANLEKKYQCFYNEPLETGQNFIQRVDLLSQKPIACRYKNIKMLGNKLKIVVNEDEPSQRLAFMALGCGLGEKGSALGMGFCFANYLK